jgi:hypothetical protein
MAHRRPHRRWHVGDQVLAPWYRTRSLPRGEIGGWQPATVVGVRGDRVVVRRHRQEREHPWWELRPAGADGRAWQFT